MLFYLLYIQSMNSMNLWNIYYGPILLGLGILLQVVFMLKWKRSFILSCLGALCISIVCYMDKDITLFIGQVFVLFFQFLIRRT